MLSNMLPSLGLWLHFLLLSLANSFVLPLMRWQACKRILQYLKGIIHLRFQFYSSGYLNLECFSDANWAANIDGRRSIAGYCVYLCSNVVSSALRNKLLFHGQALTLNILLFPWLHQRCYRWGLYLLIRCWVNFYTYHLVWQPKCHCFS